MTLIVRPGFQFDTDASTYIEAVEGPTGDNQALETATRYAINDFVIGCKQDGIWSAIKASCILSGARTLAGALIPLAGTAPTNVGGLFVSGDYNRKTGLVGNGSTKYLNSNRNNNVDPQNNNHQAIWISTSPSPGTARIYIGAGVTDTGTTHIVIGSDNTFGTRNRNGTNNSPVSAAVTGFAGHSRTTASSYTIRASATNYSASVTSETPYAGNVFVFATNPASFFTNARLAFYSIGESLDLALLDARVTALITAFGVAIP